MRRSRHALRCHDARPLISLSFEQHLLAMLAEPRRRADRVIAT
jgi:hypothetical protein